MDKHNLAAFSVPHKSAVSDSLNPLQKSCDHVLPLSSILLNELMGKMSNDTSVHTAYFLLQLMSINLFFMSQISYNFFSEYNFLFKNSHIFYREL